VFYFVSFIRDWTGEGQEGVPDVADGTRHLTGRQGDGGRRRDRSFSYKNDKNNILNMYNNIQKTIYNLLG
jgi:hypothetical protein